MSVNQPAKKLSLITLMQMIGCFLVILGHSYPFVVDIPFWAEKLQHFIYDFHMPLFVWCSGYLMFATNQTEKYSFKDYLLRRIKHILVPYFVFSLIAVVPKILLSPFLNDTLSFDALQIIRSFLVPRDSVWGHFWFLPMIFFINILGYVILKSKKLLALKILIITLLSAAMFFLPQITGWFSINDIVHFGFYFMLGIVCAKYNCLTTNKFSHLLAGTLLTLSIALFVFTKNQIAVKFIISILMVFSVFLFSFEISKRFEINKKSVFAQTYSILILSWPCQLVIEIVLERLLNASFYIIFPAMLIVGIFMPIAIIKAIGWFEHKTNTKFLSLMIGRGL